MLNDPTNIALITSTSLHQAIGAQLDAAGVLTSVPLRTITQNGGGAVRKAVLNPGPSQQELNWVTGHSLTKENKPYVTKRALNRLDIPAVDTEGRVVTASVYTLTVTPVGGPLSEVDCLNYYRTFLYALLFGGGQLETTVLGTDTMSLTTGVQILERTLQGEP